MIEVRFEALRVSAMRVLWMLVGIALVTGSVMAAAIMAMSREGVSPEAFLHAVTPSMSVAMTRGPFTVSVSVLLGVLLVSRDLRPGASGATMMLFPRRGRLFAARLAVIGAVAAVTAAATAGLSLVSATLVLPDGAAVDGQTLLRVAGMLVIAQTCFALIGAALALLTKSAGTAAAIAFGWILIVEPAARFAVFATDRMAAVAEYLPVAAANAMVHSLSNGSSANEPDLISATPVTASVALIGLTAVLATWAWAGFRNRPLL